MTFVILVDKKDNPIGTYEKMAAHKQAKLHRAISVFVSNNNNELMLQQRAQSKYHCPGLWTNTACSHPKPGEKAQEAAHRRLKEEMGFTCKLEEIYTFIYKAKFENGLTEHEFDHVFFGKYNKTPKLNPKEAMDWKWISIKKLKDEIKQKPESFTPWLRKLISSDKFLNRLSTKLS